MQQSEILSLTERLIPVYQSEDFEDILSQMTDGLAPSVKLLVKMELKTLSERDALMSSDEYEKFIAESG